jgi:hypothetical protein
VVHVFLSSRSSHAGTTDVVLRDIDSNGGVAPDSWVVATKQVSQHILFSFLADAPYYCQAFKGREAQAATFASCLNVIQQKTSQNVRNVVGHDWVTLMRAVAVHALRLRVNKDCRETIKQGMSERLPNVGCEKEKL